MAANTAPIFTLTPRTSWVNPAAGASSTSAATLSTQAASVAHSLFTAGSVGSYVQSIKIQPMGTNPQAVVRMYVNDGGATTTASTSAMIGEITVPATTASANAAIVSFEQPINKAIQAGYKIYVTFAASTAFTAGFQFTCFAGDY